MWEIDFIGRLEDKGRNKFIMVCIDHNTRWVETKIITQKTVSAISKAVEELIIEKHGIPRCCGI